MSAGLLVVLNSAQLQYATIRQGSRARLDQDQDIDKKSEVFNSSILLKTMPNGVPGRVRENTHAC